MLRLQGSARGPDEVKRNPEPNVADGVGMPHHFIKPASGAARDRLAIPGLQ